MKLNYLAGVSTAIAALVAVATVAARGDALAGPPATSEDVPLALLLSPSQYRQTITDIFDSSIRITGRFEPEARVQGMLAVGERTANVSDSGLENYDEIARGIATQVVDPEHRATLIGCKPAATDAPDDACARAFFGRVGALLYRRPLRPEELESRVMAARMGADRLHDFYSGIRLSLAEMLIAPEFLFRYKILQPDPAHAGRERLNAYSRATELSYFLWNTTPDAPLLKSAESGELETAAGLKRQVDRLMASPRLEDGVRAFFSDMLGLSDFEEVQKDPAFFPRYTVNIKSEAQEQTLRTIVDLVINRQGDYRDLFTTPHTVLTRDLAALYNVPLVDMGDNGQPQRWLPYTYPAGDPRVGILAQASFTMLWSPAGRTSPTGRGKALRENLLCQKVPPPPGNVSFKFVEDTTNPQFKTARARLTAHRSEPMCAGCHRLTDPIGLALENFDSAGEYRTTENGVPIDAAGDLSGVKFIGAAGLGKAVHDNPAATNCVATRAFAYETGYLPPQQDVQWKQIQQRFAASHYNVLDLMREIALSDLAYSVPTPQEITAANH